MWILTVTAGQCLAHVFINARRTRLNTERINGTSLAEAGAR